MQDFSSLQKRFIPILFLILAVAVQLDHGHSHHEEPKSEWDEEEFLRGYPPTPPSYWSEDMKVQMNPDEEMPARYPWLMTLHALFMFGAFFVALPAGEHFTHCALPSTGPALSESLWRITLSHTHIHPGPCRILVPWSLIRADHSPSSRLVIL